MRSFLAALLLVSLAACTSEQRATPLDRPTATITSPTAEPVVPTEVTCPKGQVTMIDLGWVGAHTFAGMLASTEQMGRPHVDRKSRRIWFLRDDGSAHSAAPWHRARSAHQSREWFIDSYEQCADHAEWSEVAAPSTRLELTVGHCWVEPVEVEGRRWDVTREEQFGWGGPTPRGLVPRRGITTEFVLSGELSVAGDVAIYVADSGVRLTLVPENDAWALNRGGCD
ncbi:hypothetical protein [Nocardioides sp.]|uniref:hypothetical protein n=1 Tax=Nocardioides sp. TaxID=35761 RepID=UPI002BA35D3A|nr:hypothetical protein [Nocardioides sp.]HSX69228.1 hypothetical protein [Nocardioides sp.]